MNSNNLTENGLLQRNRFRIVTFAFVVCLLFGTLSFISWKATHLSNFEQYNNWLNDQDHKCIVTHNIAGVKISVKYQPPLYIVSKDLGYQTLTAKTRIHLIDSLMQKQKKIFTFLLTLGPDKDIPEQKQVSSVMNEGVNSYSEFTQRVMSTNFFMDENVSLYVDGVKYKPVLSVMENLYELSDQRSFMIAFVSENGQDLNDGKEYVFEFRDPYFGMGKVQFNFLSDNLTKANNLKVIND